MASDEAQGDDDYFEIWVGSWADKAGSGNTNSSNIDIFGDKGQAQINISHTDGTGGNSGINLFSDDSNTYLTMRTPTFTSPPTVASAVPTA